MDTFLGSEAREEADHYEITVDARIVYAFQEGMIWRLGRPALELERYPSSVEIISPE
jgi:hypothetical protein